MLILSNSMCKSASTVIWWYTEQMIYDAHPTNGRAAIRDLTSSGDIAGTGSFVDHPLTDEKIDRLIKLAAKHGPTVVKVHCFLTPYLREVLNGGDALATFCYRDPRDMILSAMDHRERASKDGRTVFEHFTSVENSLEQATYWCRMSCTWVQSGLAELFQYVDTVSNPVGQIHRIAEYFNIPIADQQIETIMQRENSQRKSAGANSTRAIFRGTRTKCGPKRSSCAINTSVNTSASSVSNRMQRYQTPRKRSRRRRHWWALPTAFKNVEKRFLEGGAASGRTNKKMVRRWAVPTLRLVTLPAKTRSPAHCHRRWESGHPWFWQMLLRRQR